MTGNATEGNILTRIDQHEEMLTMHSTEISEIKTELNSVGKTLQESLLKVEESNKFLREQNSRQSEQNNDILHAVLNRNEKSDERKHDMSKVKWDFFVKLIMSLVGSGGFLYLLIEFLSRK